MPGAMATRLSLVVTIVKVVTKGNSFSLNSLPERALLIVAY